MVIFHCYVSSPEGIGMMNDDVDVVNIDDLFRIPPRMKDHLNRVSTTPGVELISDWGFQSKGQKNV